MAAPKQKRDANIKDMYVGPSLHSVSSAGRSLMAVNVVDPPTAQDTMGDTPVTRSFMEDLIDSLKTDIQALREEIAADVKELCREVVDVGNRGASMEDTLDTRGQELEVRRKEVCTHNDQLLDLQMHAEDNENRSRRNNIRIRGAP